MRMNKAKRAQVASELISGMATHIHRHSHLHHLCFNAISRSDCVMCWAWSRRNTKGEQYLILHDDLLKFLWTNPEHESWDIAIAFIADYFLATC